MRPDALPPGTSQHHVARTVNYLRAPVEVFCVVRTTDGAIGSRHHQVCPPLYETRRQAERALADLQATASSSDTYSIWTAATYVEPAKWLYDVVTADGAIIRTHGLAEGHDDESQLDCKRLAALPRP